MTLLRRGVDLTVIALGLGHESTETTLIYMHADMLIKECALAHTHESAAIPDRLRQTYRLPYLPDLLCGKVCLVPNT